MNAVCDLAVTALRTALAASPNVDPAFKAAITADPTASEPYYNLALLSARDKHLDDARNYYQQALERGAVPDPPLEAKLDHQ